MNCKAVRRGVVDGEGTKVTQVPDREFTVSIRVFYKELEGACKIVDANLIIAYVRNENSSSSPGYTSLTI